MVEGGDDADLLTDMLDVTGLANPRDEVITISMLSAAKAAIADSRWTHAQSLLEELLERNDRDAEAHRMAATVYGVQRDWDRCFDHFERADQLRPDDVRGRMYHGQVRIEAGRLEEGIEILETHPEPEATPEICAWIGRAQAQLGQIELAEQWYRRGLEAAPEDRWIRLYLANLLASSGRRAEARTEFETIVRQDPYFGLGLANYGRLLVETGELDAAAGILERALRIMPQHETTRALLDSVRQRLENTDDAS
jgi:predicted Zn-dependent protease